MYREALPWSRSGRAGRRHLILFSTEYTEM